MQSNAIKHFKFGLISLVIIIIIGTIGFKIIEPQWDFLDSFFMTMITISTTGFKEVHPLSNTGKIFTVFLIIIGVLTIAYTGGKAAQILIEKHIFRRRRMNKTLGKISNHYIVCGYGRMGKVICDELKDSGVPFVAIENDPLKIELLNDLGFYYVEGDATIDDFLILAGIKRAKGLVAVINSDAQNVFTVLSAKELNPNLFIVARAVEETTESKLIKAGADRVIKPYELGGKRMVHLLLRPGVMDFIDGVARDRDIAISLEEVTVQKEAAIQNISLINSPIREKLNIIIVAILKSSGKFIYNPSASTIIEVGDKLIAIGEVEMLAKLEKLCSTGKKQSN
jgi:voltage-gated potassium channel